MSYKVYVGQATPLYEQAHQFKSFLERFDFMNYASAWIMGEPCYTFLTAIGATWDLYVVILSKRYSLYGPREIEIEIRVYVIFQSQSDAVEFKLTYDPNVSE